MAKIGLDDLVPCEGRKSIVVVIRHFKKVSSRAVHLSILIISTTVLLIAAENE